MEEQGPDLPEGVKLMLRNDPEDAWKKVKKSLNSEHDGKQVSLNQPWLRVAASVALLIGIGAAIYLAVFNAVETHVIANNSSAVKQVLLPDSSVVFLHDRSQITYDDAYSEHRNVSMKGEAFFEVKRNPANQFKISIGRSVVQVLGTSFNIHDDTSRLDVTVATGKVSVGTPAHDVVVLEKGEKASYDKSAQKISKAANDDANYNSWLTRTLQFRNTPLTRVFPTLESYFDVKISFDQTKAAAITYTSDFNNPTLAEILAEMKDVLAIDYRESGTNVIVTIP
jgi:ferric-dicitrate binding protein FerR (iron transport regulator)